MQSVLSKIWTRVAVSISYDDNHYTMGMLFYFFRLLHIEKCKILELKKNWLDGFYGISTLIGYLVPNPVYTHIYNIYNLLTVNNQNLFVYTQLNGFKYRYCLYTFKWVVSRVLQHICGGLSNFHSLRELLSGFISTNTTQILQAQNVTTTNIKKQTI